MPIRQDLALWRGNNAPGLVWTLPAGAPPGAGYVLTIAAGGRIIATADSMAGSLVLDAGAGTLAWSPGLAESRAVPAGRIATYEIEQRAEGAETTIIFGTLAGLGGLNLDAVATWPTSLDGSEPDNSPLLLLGWLA